MLLKGQQQPLEQNEFIKERKKRKRDEMRRDVRAVVLNQHMQKGG